jgi:hypothetical protein
MRHTRGVSDLVPPCVHAHEWGVAVQEGQRGGQRQGQQHLPRHQHQSHQTISPPNTLHDSHQVWHAERIVCEGCVPCVAVWIFATHLSGAHGSEPAHPVGLGHVRHGPTER